MGEAHEAVEEDLAFGVGRHVLLTHQSEAVEGTAQRKTFEGLAVEIPQIDAASEVVDVLVRAVGLTLLDDGLGRTLTDAADGLEAKAYLTFLVDAERLVTLIDIGAERLHLHGLALLHELLDLTDIRRAARHQGGHELGGVVGFEGCRLVSHPGVAGGVRLVEGVGSKFLPVGPDFLQYLGVVAILRTLLEELRLHGVDDGFLLLTHGLTQGIALASGETGKLPGQEHHLLLVDRDAIGVLQVFLHAGDVVLDEARVFLSRDELGDVVHRSGAVEGVHGDEVLKDGGMQLLQVLLHAGRLKLERADGAALLIELVGELVVEGDVVEVDDVAGGLLDDLAGLLELRQRLQSEEVHLDEARRLDDVAVVLGHHTL